MRIFTVTILLLLFVTNSIYSQSYEIPSWLLQEWSYLTHGKGQWIADNAPFKNNNEPYDAYQLEWNWGIGKKSIVGKLNAMQNGKVVGAFWEFRTFWHPGKQKAFTEQFGGDGTYGIGEINREEEDLIMLQTFYSPDGSSYKVGHKTLTSDKEHKTTSFQINENGEWIKNREYTWLFNQKDLTRFDWLLGSWQREDLPPNRTAFESWETSGEAMAGIGISLNGLDTTFVERLHIMSKDGNYYYVADVIENKAPTYFKMTEISSTSFVAENPQHDFPKRITYSRDGQTLYAEISDGSKAKRFKFKLVVR